MTAPADLAEVRAALAMVAKATPGPWRTFGRWPNLAVVSGSGRPRIVASLASASDAVDDTPKDAAAIVALRNAAPAIAAAVEELERLRAETARQRETIRAGADAVRSANASTTEIGCRLDDAGERIAALERQVCRLVSGQEIDGDRLCQHHGADVAALALLSDERAAHAETSRDLDALLTALGAQVTPGAQTEDACHARRVADGMRRAHAAASALPPIDAAAEKLVDGLVAANRAAAGKRTAIAKAAPDVYLAPWEAEDLLKRIGNTYDLETTAGRNRADAAMRRALDLLGVSAPAAPATVARPISEWHEGMVGWLLATEPNGAIIEYERDEPGKFAQIENASGKFWRCRAWAGGKWWVWCDVSVIDADVIKRPARLVPASKADADPETRGPIGGGK